MVREIIFEKVYSKTHKSILTVKLNSRYASCIVMAKYSKVQLSHI